MRLPSTITRHSIVRPVAMAALAAVLPGGPLAAPQADPGDPGQAASAAEGPKETEKPSFFAALWHLDEETRAGRPSVTFHRT